MSRCHRIFLRIVPHSITSLQNCRDQEGIWYGVTTASNFKQKNVWKGAAMQETSTTNTPARPAATLDPARQQQARRVAGIRRWVGLADLALEALFLAAIVGLGWHLRWRDTLNLAALAAWQPIHGWQPFMVWATMVVYILAFTLLTLPLDIAGGYIVRRRFGLSTQSFAGWLADRAKSMLLGVIFAILGGEALFLTLAVAPLTWWLWLAALALIVTVLLAQLAPVLFAPLFFPMTPLPEGELRDRLLAMAARAHTRVRGVFVMRMSARTTEGNAAVMGLGPTRRIVVGDTILREYTPAEIEVVLAHELAHQVHRDIWKGILVQGVLTLGGLGLVNLGLRAILAQPITGLHGLTDVAMLPYLSALLGLYAIVTGPLGNTYSRIVEARADAYALDTTHDPTNFISAFHRLANQNLAQLDPNPIVEALFYDHPAIGRRIRMAEMWQATHEGTLDAAGTGAIS
jgi:STE24 endopeptidase